MAQQQDYHTPQHALQLNLNIKEDEYEKEELGIANDTQNASPSVCGMPLKYVSLVTLAVQNALLTLIMHYSRVSAAPSQTYSAASAVLLTELLKGSISLAVAFVRLDSYSPPYGPNDLAASSSWNPRVLLARFRRLGKEVFRSDCWKLSIPAILYVIQNNLQFVAVSNLEAATFQVSYQMKILTTAAFSVIMLRKKLSPTKWMALLFLAIGVGIVQIQSGAASSHSSSSGHEMNAFKGFMAVVAACFTSGLAGVYFEMVLKNSPGDLWVRNVQLSLFSLLPALVPIIFTRSTDSTSSPQWFGSLFENFGVWAWATVSVQVLGGLLTALVIKYADNILKGFATSLSIVISFLASVALFNFHMTVTFILGSMVVLVATWLYNQPDGGSSSEGGCKSWSWRWQRHALSPRSASALELSSGTLSRRASTSSLSSISTFSVKSSKSYPGSPVERDSPRLPELNALSSKRRFNLAMPLRATRTLAARLGLIPRSSHELPYTLPSFASQSLQQSAVLSRPKGPVSMFPGHSVSLSALPNMDNEHL